MPKGLIPTRSPAHRLVCCSLYKALLTTCRNFAQDENSSRSALNSQLQSLVKFRFRHDQDLQQPIQIRDSLEYGRRSLSLLAEARYGSIPAQREMIETLKGTLDLASLRAAYKSHCDKDKGNYPAHVLKKKEYIAKMQDPMTYVTPKPGSIAIASRPVPLSQIKSKRRRYPQLVVTQGIPFLRYHRRQSHWLSAYLRREIKKSTKSWDLIHEMDALIQLGRYEDAWDAEINKLATTNLGLPGQHDLSWTTDTMNAKRELSDRMKQVERKRMSRGRDMYDIMLAERRLAVEEQEAEKAERKARKLKAIKEEVPIQNVNFDPIING